MKVPNRNHKAERTQLQKFNRRVQQKTSSCERRDQQTQRQCSGIWQKAKKIKKEKWRQSNEPETKSSRPVCTPYGARRQSKAESSAGEYWLKHLQPWWERQMSRQETQRVANKLIQKDPLRCFTVKLPNLNDLQTHTRARTPKIIFKKQLVTYKAILHPL